MKGEVQLITREHYNMECSTLAIHFSWLGPELLTCCLAHWGSTGVSFSFSPDFQQCCLAPMDLHRRATYCICESSILIPHGGYHDL